jgi:hypothetical protein
MTIFINGDPAEAAKYRSTVNHYLNELTRTFGKNNRNQSYWRQLSDTAKVHLRLIDGKPFAYLYVEGGGLFVTFWDTDTAIAPNIGQFYDELYVGRLFYKNTLEPTKKNNYKVGGWGYWYSQDKKSAISWSGTDQTGLLYIKGNRYLTTPCILCAAINNGRLMTLIGAYDDRFYGGHNLISARLITHTPGVGEALTTKTTSTILFNPKFVDASTFEISKDFTLVTFICAKTIYKITISPGYEVSGIAYGYELSDLIKVLELIPSASISTDDSSVNLDYNVGGGGSPGVAYWPRTHTLTSSSVVIPDPDGQGEIITGRQVGRDYHYLYAYKSVAGTGSGFTTATLMLAAYGDGGGGVWYVHTGSRADSSSTSGSITTTLKVGVVNLDTLVNTLAEEPCYTEDNTYSTGYAASITYVPAGTYTMPSGLVVQLTDAAYTYTQVDSADSTRFKVVAFYPEKKVVLLQRDKVATTTTGSLATGPNEEGGTSWGNSVTTDTTRSSELILFKNDKVVTGEDKAGLTAEETLALYGYTQQSLLEIPPVTTTDTVFVDYEGAVGHLALGIGAPWYTNGQYPQGSSTYTAVSTTALTTDAAVAYDYAENGSILAAKAQVGGTINYKLVLDIDNNDFEEEQFDHASAEGIKQARLVFSTTT